MGTGKTTELLKWIEKINKGHLIVRGITNPITDEKKNFKDLSTGLLFAMETNNTRDKITIGRYTFSQKAFDDARAILDSASAFLNDLFIIDEIGKLELQGKGLEPSLSSTINEAKKNSKNLILVVRSSLLDQVVKKYDLYSAKVLKMDELNEVQLTRSSKTAVLLVGGRSKRMGRDKSLILNQGIPQWKWMHNQLSGYFDQVYLSCREEQYSQFKGCKKIIDQYDNIGPIGGISSAFGQIRDVNKIFFTACDLFQFDIDIVKHLYSEMHGGYELWAIQGRESTYPEPLVAVWSRDSFPLVLEQIRKGNYALMPCLDLLKSQTIPYHDHLALKNTNTPSDL